jgi:hypothetical protein
LTYLPPVSDLALELVAIASLVRRLRPDWRDAEAFYELRSEVTGRLLKLSHRRRNVPLPVACARLPAPPSLSTLKGPVVSPPYHTRLRPPPRLVPVSATAGSGALLPHPTAGHAGAVQARCLTGDQRIAAGRSPCRVADRLPNAAS